MLKNGCWSEKKLMSKIANNHLDVSLLNQELNDLEEKIRALKHQKEIIRIKISKKQKYRNLLINNLKEEQSKIKTNETSSQTN